MTSQCPRAPPRECEMRLAIQRTPPPTQAHPQPDAPTMEKPIPQRDLPGTTVAETPIPSPLQLREEARIAFLAQPMLIEPDQLEMDHVSALLALLVEGEWSATIVRLLAKQSPKKKASAI